MAFAFRSSTDSSLIISTTIITDNGCRGGTGTQFRQNVMLFVFHPLTAPLAERASTWFDSDAVGANVFGDFYGIHPKWWELVKDDPTRLGWLIADRGGDLGFVDLEIVGAVGYLSFYIASHRRKRGYGRQILADVAIKARRMDLAQLEGSVDPENIASLRCCAAAGFANAGNNEYGEIIMRLEL